jgi:hypothetical protein
VWNCSVWDGCCWSDSHRQLRCQVGYRNLSILSICVCSHNGLAIGVVGVVVPLEMKKSGWIDAAESDDRSVSSAVIASDGRCVVAWRKAIASRIPTVLAGVCAVRRNLQRPKMNYLEALQELVTSIKTAASKSSPYFWKLTGDEENSLGKFLGMSDNELRVILRLCKIYTVQRKRQFFEEQFRDVDVNEWL